MERLFYAAEGTETPVGSGKRFRWLLYGAVLLGLLFGLGWGLGGLLGLFGLFR
jgi:hypothetical protein